MILIADGGSTKTDWRVINQDVNYAFHTLGINPLHNNDDQIINEINRSDMIKLRAEIKEIHFYGAGLATDELKNKLKNLFEKLFPFANSINIYDDLLAAARSLFKNKAGIVCIMGTGSNSCFYDGTNVVDKIPALGYILGDEGSGANLGIRFINAWFKNDISDSLKQKISEDIKMDMAEVLENVYKKHLPNRYLATFTKIMNKHIKDKEISVIVHESFSQFVNKNINKYKNAGQLSIGFVGSIAFHFKDILKIVLDEHGLILGPILQSPMEALIDYHKNIK